MSNEPKTVLIIGGGIAGLSAARDLSRLDVRVELVEKADFLGGHAIQYACKATDTCLQCGACKVEATLKEVVSSDNIHVHLASEVKRISRNGRFSVQLSRTAVNKADGFDTCASDYQNSPVQCAGIRGYSLHNTRYYTADGRINTETTAQAEQVEADAVILASGFSPFDATCKSTYRYGDLDNVITGLDLERTKRATGTLVRPSDGQTPQKIAFIQCVGSRDERLGHLWCSQVCCPYALRTAMSLKHKYPDLDITVFYMDIQNTGNSFNDFFPQCREALKFVRTIPVDMYAVEGGGVQTRYMSEADGIPVQEIFDLVVLSVGIMPGSDNPALAETLNIPLNSDGFAAGLDALDTTATKAGGVFLAGTVAGPKTIANTMAHAGQAAGNVIAYLRRAS